MSVDDPQAADPPLHGIRDSVRAVLRDRKSRNRILLYLLGISVLIGMVAVFGKWIGAHLPGFETWIHSLGYWGPIVFVASFVILSLFQIPESLLAITAGVCFIIISSRCTATVEGVC